MWILVRSIVIVKEVYENIHHEVVGSEISGMGEKYSKNVLGFFHL